MVTSITLCAVFVAAGITFLRNQRQAEIEGTAKEWIFDPQREEKRKAREEIQARKERWDVIRKCPNNLVGLHLKSKAEDREFMVFTLSCAFYKR